MPPISNGGPAIARRHSRPAQLALQERVERRVGVADNDNDRCASPGASPAQHLAVSCGIGGQGGSGLLSQIRRRGEGCGEESG
jgi:hypothetical protein